MVARRMASGGRQPPGDSAVDSPPETSRLTPAARHTRQLVGRTSCDRIVVFDANERLAIEFGDAAELVKKATGAEKGLAADNPAMWRAAKTWGSPLT